MRTSIVLLALTLSIVDVDGAVLKRQQTGIERNAPCGQAIGKCADGLCCSEWGALTLKGNVGQSNQLLNFWLIICSGVALQSIIVPEIVNLLSAHATAKLPHLSLKPTNPADREKRLAVEGSAAANTVAVVHSMEIRSVCPIVELGARWVLECATATLLVRFGTWIKRAGMGLENVDGCQSGFGNCNNPPATPIFTCPKPNGFLLTYDDGPAVLTDGLLDYLKSKNAKATFFMNGKNYKQYFNNGNLNTPFGISALASTVQRAANDGHQLCMHGFTHTDAITASERNFTYEITETTRVFAQALGKVPTCFRFPYGDFEEKHLRILGGMGITPILWDADPRDWENGDPQGGLTELQNTAPNPGSVSHIVLNHDVVNNTADFRPTRAVSQNLAELSVEYLQSKNFQFLTAADCVGDGQTPLYRNPTPNDLVCRPEGCFES
ncbi:hypothetical protein SpCBS45565_g08344 [Spizellomyces sp. 'palustris']|nr:hypothetical protein SpCBS45565_g08344 [Spizellomyces sp. 'palustris']